MAQERVHKRSTDQKHNAYIEPAAQHKETEREAHAKATAEVTDELLDEIDEILNAEGVEQLVNFKQQGGQ